MPHPKHPNARTQRVQLPPVPRLVRPVPRKTPPQRNNQRGRR